MTDVESQAKQQNHISKQDLNKAMNLVGNNLYGALGQTLQQLPEELRKREIILQGVSGFVANIIYQQTPNDPEIRQEMLEQINKLVNVHLHGIMTSS